jgi:1-acyl-sn-glycerol-3-phosphate acyltransferase
MAKDAPIIPCAFRNVGKIKQKGKMIRFPKVEVEFGDPILLSDFDCLEKRDRLPACSWYCMREVFAMRDKIKSDEVDMASLFPDDEDYSELLESIKIKKHTTDELLNAN